MSLKKILKWAGKRAKEKSTWTGLAMIAASVGLPGVGAILGQFAILVPIIGGVLVGAKTQPDEPSFY